MMFRTQYSNNNRIRTQAGSRTQPTYKLKVNEDGSRTLKKVGEKNTYAEIQSFKDSTDIHYILARYASGDVSALSKVQGLYGDFTEMPKSLQELSQRVIDAENIFYSLPLDDRAKFNHSPSEFFASFGSEKFNSIFVQKNEELQLAEGGSQTSASQTEGGTVNE